MCTFPGRMRSGNLETLGLSFPWRDFFTRPRTVAGTRPVRLQRGSQKGKGQRCPIVQYRSPGDPFLCALCPQTEATFHTEHFPACLPCLPAGLLGREAHLAVLLGLLLILLSLPCRLAQWVRASSKYTKVVGSIPRQGMYKNQPRSA